VQKVQHLRNHDHLTIQGIADITGVPLGTVQWWLEGHRGHRDKTWPAAPLHEGIKQAGVSHRFFVKQGIHFHMHRDHYTETVIDRVCAALGLHPCEVYGPEWFTTIDISDLEDTA
jgi:hypothetical protein